MTPLELAQMLTAAKRASGLTDRAVLGGLVQACDRGRDFVEGDNNYVWWFLLGAAERPRTLLEIGTRFGYSLWALASGARGEGRVVGAVVYDAQVDDDVEPLKVCEEWFLDHGIPLITHRQNTQERATLEVPCPVDLAVVDADHSDAGAYHDCGLAWAALRPGGLLVVDDTNPGEVRDAAERFARARGVSFAFLPSLRGIHLLRKPEAL